MTDMLLVYITCESVEQAKEIGKKLMEKKLCACINIFPEMKPMFFWPPKSGTIDESDEVVLIAKTIESKYKELEEEIYKIHSYDTPCIIAIPVKHVGKKYYDWLVGELDSE
ncbi:divalent-cation tolerance protein CutA [Patescibacteria group bacterium]